MAARTTKPRRQSFAVCVANEGCEDLQLFKVYRVVPDAAAAAEDFLRIVDDSGEDYLYPSHRFVVVEFPPAVTRRLLALHGSSAHGIT